MALKSLLTIVAGALVTLLGIILMPVPGPGGTPVFLAGLAILAMELPWARALKDRVEARLQVSRTWKKSLWHRIGIVTGLVIIYGMTTVIIYRIWMKWAD